MIDDSSVPYTHEPNTCEELFGLLTGDTWFDEELLLDIGRSRSLWVHRGLNKNYPLETSLIRLGGDYWKLEAHLLRNFRKYSPTERQFPDSFWYWLAFAQHHRLPTRLLDWTLSPLVGLHFATNETDDFGEDGCLWSVHRKQVHDALPPKIRRVLGQGGNEPFNFTVEMLSALPKMPPNFHPPETFRIFDNSKRRFLLFFEPPSLDLRIVNQFALFSIMNSPTALLDDWLRKHPAAYRKIRIQAKLKLGIRDRLDSYNLTERVFFPGCDGTALWLKRHYKNLGKREKN